MYKYEGGYEEYLNKQILHNRRSRRKQWATEGDIEFICRMMIKRNWPHFAGLCHGTRSGMEMRWFRKHLWAQGGENGLIIGSDLHPVQRKFDPLTFQWDFNTVNPQWEGRFDFVYSNSVAHAYDFPTTLGVWRRQLRPGGILILEHSDEHVKPSALLPSGMKIHDMLGVVSDTLGMRLVSLLRFRPSDSTKKYLKRYLVLAEPKRGQKTRPRAAF